MIRKLGSELVENYLVFNHNVYEHHVKMGTTSRGTPVLINREVAGCDLKIGVGALIPHFEAGYGGGAKILMPGVSGIDTIAHNHVDVTKGHPELVGLGKVKNNPQRLDMEEVGKCFEYHILDVLWFNDLLAKGFTMEASLPPGAREVSFMLQIKLVWRTEGYDVVLDMEELRVEVEVA